MMQRFKSSYRSCLHTALGLNHEHEGTAVVFIQYINKDASVDLTFSLNARARRVL